ncbi:hypothetical protein CAEBREN_18493 [Caenorhabditis brenneri]|uniref:Uncharacterized protein n=1 Tax=Caenorhabditis brenneri TaxID=135651 RepID=G0NGM0_CAEBE|nr:hypothetical protein CAEBREN_18493 [Caenorhabditis brenneri]
MLSDKEEEVAPVRPVRLVLNGKPMIRMNVTPPACFLKDRRKNPNSKRAKPQKRSTVQPGGGKRTWLQVPCFKKPVILRCQVGWPGELLNVTVFRPEFSPAQGALSSLEATWEVVFPLAMGLQSRFYPATIGSHHGEVMLLTTFRVETKEWKEVVPGVGSVVRKEHQWINEWLPRETLVNRVVFPLLAEHGTHDHKLFRCQVQALRDGKWFCMEGGYCHDSNMWRISWNAPVPGMVNTREIRPMVTVGGHPKGYTPLRKPVAGSSEDVITDASFSDDGDSDFEIIDSEEGDELV